jgi:GDP-L-fucose synthase
MRLTRLQDCGHQALPGVHRRCGANFISALPTNLYGPNDNFDLETSHVLAALIHKAHEAKVRRKKANCGTGKPRREFLHVDDLASACLLLLEKYDSPEIINVGCGGTFRFANCRSLICEVVGFDGELAWDTSKPDGTAKTFGHDQAPRSRLEAGNPATGWNCSDV